MRLLKRDEKAFVDRSQLLERRADAHIIQGENLTGSTIHTDGWKAYDDLILNERHHYHHRSEFARKKSNY